MRRMMLAALVATGFSAQAGAQPTAPPDQERLLAIVANYGQQHRTAPNAMAAGGLRPQRAKEICAVFQAKHGTVSGWVSTIERLDSTASGRGVLTVRLNAIVALQTWGLEMSDSTDRTLIPSGSALFQRVAGMRVGQRVRVSGSFLPSRDDCLKETSVTVDGAMRAPHFLFRFSQVEAVN